MTVSFPTVIPYTEPDVDGATPEPTAGRGPVEAGPRGGAHIVGAFSLETFCDVGGLTYTHEDAYGFLRWLQSFGYTPNFWFRDAAVKIWAYEELYDNWQDTYGLDADLLSYHSGHGGMDGNGVFYLPMGAAWAGNDCTATSATMAPGNEYCRYLFWSTCLSLRVLDGHSPIRTWRAANKGLRMIFGFETISWDSPDYGKNFGDRWNAGDSLSSAWLNGSWAIAHDQAPSASACGATAQEAQDRVFNERYFSWAAASTAWWWWRWYYAAAASRELNRAMPDRPLVARLAPASARSASVAADAFGVDAATASETAAGMSMTDGRRRVTIARDGTLVAELSRPNRENRDALDPSEAKAIAGQALRQFGLDTDVAVVLDRVADVNEAGAATERPDAVEGPFRTATMVQYRQVINGVPVVTPGAGTIRVLVDNDGTVTSITSTTRIVDDLIEHPSNAPFVEPVAPGAQPRTTSATPDPDRLLARATSTDLRTLATKGDLPVALAPVPGTMEIGYDVQGDSTVLVAQRAVELDYGDGYRKRRWVTAPIVT